MSTRENIRLIARAPLGSRKNTNLWSVKIILILASALCQMKTVH